MKKVIYAKYNRTRVPKYQTVTKIVEQDGKRYVLKEALLEEAREHVNSMEGKSQRLAEIYANITPCKCYIDNEVAIFDYHEGQSVAEIIESNMGSLEEVLATIGKYVDLLFKYKDEYIIEFQNDASFEAVFGSIKGLEGAASVQGADIDLIFDNVYYVGDKYVCIDYEWTMDCSIPVGFIKYRTLFYFYVKNYAYFQDKISDKDFLEHFGIYENMQLIYKQMDDTFQQMVHGPNWVNIYTRKYEKKVRGIKELLTVYPDVGGIIEELRIRNNKLEKDLEIYKNGYESMESSVSWKITAPVRKVLRYMRGK